MKKIITILMLLCTVIFISSCSFEHTLASQSTEIAQQEIPSLTDTITPQDKAQTNTEGNIEELYWDDPVTDPTWPSESIVSEENREQIQSEYKKGYELIKNQPWITEECDTQVADNIQLLLEATSQLTGKELPRITYAHVKTSVLANDIENYFGELLYWAAVNIDEVEEVPESSEFAQTVNNGKPFCIVHSTTRHDESILLYVMDTTGIDSWYGENIARSSIKAWMVGVERDAIVLCVPALAGG